MTETQPARDVGEKRRADLLVFGRLIAMDPATGIVDDGALAVVAGDIAAAGPRSAIEAAWTAARRIDRPNAIVIPGMIDAHTHCTQCFVRGLTTNELPMIPRLYNPAQRSLSPAQAGDTVRLLAAQLLRSGVTTLCEGTLNPAHEEAIVEALEEIGIRCVMARGSPDQDFHHAALYSQIRDRSWVKAREGEAETDLKRTADFLDRYPARGAGLIRGGVNASALPGFSSGYFRAASALARRRGASLHVHVARDREEVELSLALWGKRPIERMAELGVVDEHLVAVHAVLASPREIALLGEGRASLAHSPIECVANLNAVPDVAQFLAAGCAVALGCDNQANDMFASMRAAWLLQGGLFGMARYDPEYLRPDRIFAMATAEGAKVLRLDDRVGKLVPGMAADLVVIDGDQPHLLAMQDPIGEIVRYGSRAEITHVLVDGKILVENGKPTTIDLDRLRAAAAAGARHVRSIVLDRRYRPL